MAEKPKDQIFTLPQQYVVDIIEECSEQISMIEDLLKDLINEKVFSYKKKAVLPYIAELVWMNHAIMKNINLELDTLVLHYNETTQEEEYIFTERSVLELQNYMLARWYAITELNRMSCTISLH